MNAPICIFAYNRVDHLQQLLESLRRCPQFLESELYIFADGPRANREGDEGKTAAVREFIQQIEHPRKHAILAESNQGLSRSIRKGVSHCLENRDKVIVLEDDLIAKPELLQYMNGALQRYADASRVFQISGHAFPTPSSENSNEAYFLPFITSWGWGTWKRVWETVQWSSDEAMKLLGDNPALQTRFDLDDSYRYFNMLSRQHRGQVDSWAILWYWNCFLRDGITLYPPRTLIENTGFDGSGTHGSRDISGRISGEKVAPRDFTFPVEPLVNVRKYGEVTVFLRELGKVQFHDLMGISKKVLYRIWKK